MNDMSNDRVHFRVDQKLEQPNCPRFAIRIGSFSRLGVTFGPALLPAPNHHEFPFRAHMLAEFRETVVEGA